MESQAPHKLCRNLNHPKSYISFYLISLTLSFNKLTDSTSFSAFIFFCSWPDTQKSNLEQVLIIFELFIDISHVPTMSHNINSFDCYALSCLHTFQCVGPPIWKATGFNKIGGGAKTKAATNNN